MTGKKINSICWYRFLTLHFNWKKTALLYNFEREKNLNGFGAKNSFIYDLAKDIICSKTNETSYSPHKPIMITMFIVW